MAAACNALTNLAAPLILIYSAVILPAFPAAQVKATKRESLLLVRVFYHDKCFDGACSASLFTRFHRECIAPNLPASVLAASSNDTAEGGCHTAGVTYQYHGLVHRAGALFDDSEFDSAPNTPTQNAIVDFKYSPRVTWWFDHHQSAFLTPEDRANFIASQYTHNGILLAPNEQTKFFDPTYTSCASFIAHIAETNFGFNTAPVSDLIYWANIVDGAKYSSPQSAVEMAEPAMKLTLIIEASQDPLFIPRLIPLLTELPLADVLAQPFVTSLLPPLLERHQQAIALIKDRAELRDGTIFFDITDHPMEGFNKFIPYYLHPDATYSIGLSKSSFRTKVAVGTNPWTKIPPANLVNLAAICERYGGGGHARVGAISFPPDQESAARTAALEIVSELRAANPHLLPSINLNA